MIVFYILPKPYHELLSTYVQYSCIIIHKIQSVSYCNSFQSNVKWTSACNSCYIVHCQRWLTKLWFSLFKDEEKILFLLTAIGQDTWSDWGICAQRLCECDRQLAECLRRYPCPRTKAVCTSSPWRLLQNVFML